MGVMRWARTACSAANVSVLFMLFNHVFVNTVTSHPDVLSVRWWGQVHMTSAVASVDRMVLVNSELGVGDMGEINF